MSYGENLIHYATCIPEGEGRYVMDRGTGEIETVKGPAMLLLNPITHIMIRRVLTDQESQLMYPGNDDSLNYNRRLRMMLGDSPSARSGFVSEGDYSQDDESVDYMGLESRGITARSRKSDKPAVEEFKRRTEYTQPHTITLGGNTKFDGVPKLIIWTGYAVLVVKADGTRRTEIGPKTILLDFDETIEPIHLSKGTPKSADNLFRTGYLRVVNNKVSDLIQGVETADNIKVDIRLSYRVTFDPDAKGKWFDVENYVQFLVEHGRSKQKRLIKGFTIEQFYNDSVAIVRDNILGVHNENGARPGLSFEENGMKVTDVEVLDTPIQDANIANLLVQVQHETISDNIEMDRLQKQLEVAKKREVVLREEAQTKFDTEELKNELQLKKLALTLKVVLEEYTQNQKKEELTLELAKVKESTLTLHHVEEVKRQKDVNDLEKAKLDSETSSVVTRLGAAQEGFAEALLAMSDKDALVRIAEASSVQTLLGGQSLTDVLGKIFQGTSLQEGMQKITARGAFGGH